MVWTSLTPLKWLKLAAYAALFGLGVWVGLQWNDDTIADLELERAEYDRDEARATLTKERQQHDEISQALQEQADEQKSINTRLVDDLERVRDRAERATRAAETDCAGASGTELSRQDSSFLIREAARADGIRAALRACYAYADSVSGLH